MIVVLAVNALEADRVEADDLPNLQLAEHGRLAVPDELPLHTEVLWPSIITSTLPDEHGLTRTGAREWENPLLEFAAEYGTKLVPERVLLPIGRQIQRLGFDRESKSGPEYYAERGLETVFADRRSAAIDVPGYSQWDDADEIRELMNHSEYDPDDEALFRRRSRDRFDRKRARLFEAVEEPLDLCVCYFQTLDNLQHVYWSDDEVLREWYREFDALVAELRDRLGPDDEVIVMSDHGMQAGEGGTGEHTDYGYYASTVPLGMETILDLKPALDRVLDRPAAVRS